MKRNSSKSADHSAKKHSGFTLVELVVVIAVLAILAGVGAVAYKGYIDYAKRAKDEVLLGAANEAFAAASEEQHFDRTVLKTGQATLTGDTAKTIGGVGTVRGVLNVSEFSDAFMTYFAGNENNELQKYTRYQIQYDGNKHMFVFNEKAYADPASVLKDSSHNVDSLSKPVNSLASFLERLKNGDSSLNWDGIRPFLKGALEKASTLDEKIQAIKLAFSIGGLGFNDEILRENLISLGLTDDSNYIELINGVILSAAQQTVNGGADTDALVDAVLSGNKDEIGDNGLIVFPMALGKLAGYRNSKYASAKFKADYDKMFGLDGDPGHRRGMSGSMMKEQLESLGQMANNDAGDGNETGWNAYLNSGQAQKDMDAYLAAMQLLCAHSDKVNLSDENMIGEGEFADLINGMLGQGQ